MKLPSIQKLLLACFATVSLLTLTSCETLDDHDDDDDDDDRRYRGSSTTTTTEEITLRRRPVSLPGQVSTTTETQTTRSY
jgi:hypothetical protein